MKIVRATVFPRKDGFWQASTTDWGRHHVAVGFTRKQALDNLIEAIRDSHAPFEAELAIPNREEMPL